MGIQNIAIVFLSIFFESLPFLLLGSLISSIIERYVSDEMIAKIIPRNAFLGSLVGVFLGFFIPACDCAVIPVSKRLIKRKVPLNVAVSFMLASPIINPVVLLSTYYAFYKTNPILFWMRPIFGILIALLIGVIMGIIFTEDITKNNHEEHCCHNEHCHHEEHKQKKSFKNDILFIIKHTALDLFEVVKYLMFGAFLASVIQIAMPRNMITLFSNNKILSIIALMLFAYLISLCSTSDSFVGKSLVSTFGSTSILAYLLLGPMIDIKNTIVLFGNFKSKFVVTLISLIFISIFIFCLLAVNIL